MMGSLDDALAGAPAAMLSHSLGRMSANRCGDMTYRSLLSPTAVSPPKRNTVWPSVPETSPVECRGVGAFRDSCVGYVHVGGAAPARVNTSASPSRTPEGSNPPYTMKHPVAAADAAEQRGRYTAAARERGVGGMPAVVGMDHVGNVPRA